MTMSATIMNVSHTETTSAELVAAVDRLVASHPPESMSPEEFAGAQYDAGLAWPHFPLGHGGIGAPRWAEAVVKERLAELGAPDLRRRNIIGYGMAAPTIAVIGTGSQRDRFLRRIFTCEDIWCQLYSEPGAGSDLAGLASRATRDGDIWRVNGQKVWTSYAHVAKYGLLMARTDPEATKYQGLTYMVLDLEQPSVDVRPLRQITGDAEFNEVFFTDSEVPVENVLGDVNDGWRGALLTLMNERAALGAVVEPRGSGPIAMAVDLWNSQAQQSDATRHELMQLWIRAEVLRLLNARRSEVAATSGAGPEDSISKLAFAELSQAIYEFCLRLQGPAGTLYKSYEMRRLETTLSGIDDPSWMFLRTRANTIAGGTSEVMRNIIGERLLGLPQDIRVDKGVPWSDIPR